MTGLNGQCRVRRTVLLADDDSLLREIVAITLAPGNMTVLHARDGQEALDIAKRHRPDLVLLDVVMPTVDGLEVCRRLKADPSTAGIKVIMLTAQSSAENRADALTAGADGYFSKPFSPVALLTAVAQASGIDLSA